MEFISLITLVAPLCCFGIVFVGMAVFISTVLWRSLQPCTQDEFVKAAQDAWQKLRNQNQLLPWQAHAFSNMRAEWKGHTRSLRLYLRHREYAHRFPNPNRVGFPSL